MQKSMKPEAANMADSERMLQSEGYQANDSGSVSLRARYFWRWRCLCLLVTSLGLAGVSHAGSSGDGQTVEVHSLAHPELRSYAKLLEGQHVFDRYHSLAPGANLRYVMHPRVKDVNMENLQVRIAGETVSIPLVLDSALRFSVPENTQALAENADVMYNRKDGSIAWRPDIRSPGVPSGARRLGDLRLECKVDAMGAHVGRSFGFIGLLKLSGDDPCENSRFVYHFYADRPVFNVTISEGNRKQVLLHDELYGNDFDEILFPFLDWPLLRDQVYTAPLRDHSWSDEALVWFEFQDVASGATGTKSGGMR